MPSNVQEASTIKGSAIRTFYENELFSLNGSLKQDNNKAITNIEYNLLNLPKSITFSNGNSVSYTYDATGQKLSKTTVTGSTTNTKTYLGSVEYQDANLEAIYFDEGRLTPSGSTLRYEYSIKDHLGNNRIYFCDLNGNNSIQTALEILQEESYYPFGLQHSGTKTAQIGTENLYQYNGKEYNTELAMYDYGARFYQADIGRWGVIDPLAEKYYPVNPYNYVANNPLKFIDPNGKEIIISPSLKNSEKRQVMRNIKKLTNDKLNHDKITGQVSISKQNIGNKNDGTTLIRNLISDTKTNTIEVTKGSGNSATATNWTDAQNGIGANAIVYFDPKANPDIPTVDPKTGNVSGEKRPNQIGLGHELIHADHINNGDVNLNSDTHTYKNESGNNTIQTVRSEELRTVGLKGVKAGDITENNIREEQRRTKNKQRGAY